MEPTTEEQFDRQWIEAERALPTLDRPSERFKCFPPLQLGPVVVGKTNTVSAVSDPVHKVQPRARHKSVERMILDQNTFSRGRGRLPLKEQLDHPYDEERR